MGSSESTTTTSWPVSTVEDVDNMQCLIEFIKPIDIWSEGDGGHTFPSLNETIKCSVYSWRNRVLHESVVIEPRIKDYDGLVIDLVTHKTGTNFWVRASRAKRRYNTQIKIKKGDIIIEDKRKDWKYFGEIRSTIFNICNITNDVINDFEEYHLISNNCQIFVQKLLSKLLGKEVKYVHDTTATKINKSLTRFVAGSVVGAGGVVPGAIAGNSAVAVGGVVTSTGAGAGASVVTGTGAGVASTGVVSTTFEFAAACVASIIPAVASSTALHASLELQHHRVNHLHNELNYKYNKQLQRNYEKCNGILLCGYIRIKVEFTKYVSNDIVIILLKYMQILQLELNENIKNLMVSNNGKVIMRIKPYDYICYTSFGMETYTKNQKKIWKFQVDKTSATGKIVIGVVSYDQESVIMEGIDDEKVDSDKDDKCGYLHTMPSYQRRWIILNEALLSCFTTKPENKTEKENNFIESFDLNHYNIDKISYNTTYQFKLISKDDGKEQAFISTSHYDMLCWRKAIENAQKGITYRELSCEPLVNHKRNQVHLRYGLQLSNGHIFNNDIESKLCEGFSGITTEDVDDVITMQLNLCGSKGTLSYKIDGILKEKEVFNNLDSNKSYRLAIGFYDLGSISLI